jgi:hypothetical protein
LNEALVGKQSSSFFITCPKKVLKFPQKFAFSDVSAKPFKFFGRFLKQIESLQTKIDLRNKTKLKMLQVKAISHL